jgi:hypothetical protein
MLEGMTSSLTLTTYTELTAPIIDDMVLTESDTLLALGSGVDMVACLWWKSRQQSFVR